MQSKIQIIRHKERKSAQAIHSLLQSAYTREAGLIGMPDFPPLHRTVSHIQQSSSTFTGLFEDNRLMALAELRYSGDTLHIDSFVVEPQSFRKGYGSRLLSSVLSDTSSPRVLVETAQKNEPALRLYRKFGFETLSCHETPEGLTMITLALPLNP